MSSNNRGTGKHGRGGCVGGGAVIIDPGSAVDMLSFGFNNAAIIGPAIASAIGVAAKISIDVIRLWFKARMEKKIVIKSGDTEVEITGIMSTSDIRNALKVFEQIKDLNKNNVKAIVKDKEKAKEE